MQFGEKLYEGKAKILCATDDPTLVTQYFKDDATAFNAQKRGTIMDKGICNNRIASALFTYLEGKGIPTHFVRQLDERTMLVKRLDIIPLEVTMRNIVAGGMAKLLAVAEGMVLKLPVFEWHYKSDALGDPLINDDHILAMGWATRDELAFIRAQSGKVNDALKTFFNERQLDLVDFKLEFGRFPAAPAGQRAAGGSGQILLGDEISPDTMRLWEHGTRRKLDKDRFRRDLGSVEEAYQEVLRRVLGATYQSSPASRT